MTFGQKLQLLRKEKGISQEALAAQLGVSRQAVSRWELDISLPETENVIKIGRIFDVSYDYLLREDIDNKNNMKQKEITNNHYVGRFMSFMKKYGFYLGYVFSAISLYCAFGYTVSFIRVQQILKVPEGFTSVIENNYTTTYTIMIFYIVLAFAGTISGALIGKYAEKKTAHYRNDDKREEKMEI